jgi:hypothetical protein
MDHVDQDLYYQCCLLVQTLKGKSLHLKTLRPSSKCQGFHNFRFKLQYLRIAVTEEN